MNLKTEQGDGAGVGDGASDLASGLHAAGAQAESSFREVIERSPESVLVLVDGRIVYANEAFVAAFGAASQEALLGRPALDLIHPEDREASRERIERAARTGRPGETRETRGLRDDGSVLHIETVVVPTTFEGSPALVIFGRDTTERRRQADLLRAAEARFRQAFDHAPIGMALLSLDGRWLQVNRALSAMLDRPVGGLIGRSIDEVARPDGQAPADPAERLRQIEVNRYGQPIGFARPDGAAVDATLHLSLVRPDGDAAVHYIAQIMDVTAQRQAERAMRESERRSRTLARHVPVGIHESDLDGVCTYVNDRWCALTGYSAEQVVGKPWSVIVDPDDRDKLLAEWAASSAQGREFGMECRFRGADGRAVWVYVTCATMRDDQGRAVGFLGTALDVAERKQAQAQLLFNDRMASVGTLAAGVAHEINNPLAYVTANLDLIVEEVRALAAGLPADRVREIEELASEGRQGAEKVRRIVRALKTFARADEERRVRLDVHSVLDLSINMVSTELRQRARIVRDYQWVPAVEADEARLGQVFINLLINAAQALPEGASERNTIRLVTRTNPAGRVFIEVHDTGSGIAPEHREQIFDPFFTTRPVGRGIGLGLSICHGIVTALGGDISVVSEPGRGSTFTVSLPGVPVEVMPEVAAQPLVEVRKRDGRILVVDDDPMVGTTLRRVLEREHEVTVVESGREALTLIGAGERYDVILCDVMMPQMTGIELHAELGRLAVDQQERMIFVTGGTFTPKARAFFDRAPNALIEKPFNLRNLRAVVREQLQLLRTGLGLDQ